MTDDLEEAIETAATSPESATSDGVTVKQRSLSEMIAADHHLAAKRAARNFTRAFTRVKIVPPGSV